MAFEQQFSTEEKCIEYLFQLRWPNGFLCPYCKNNKAWKIKIFKFECTECHRQISILAGTIFQDSHKSIQIWFTAIWWVVTQKNGASALGIKRIMGFGSYKTAWLWLHKLRRVMIRPGRDNLSGLVEVDETIYGGEKSGKRGRGAAGKALIGIAVEDKLKDGIGRIRLGVLSDASQNSLSNFIKNKIVEGSIIRTDDWSGYNNIESQGYKRKIINKHELKLVHLVASLLKRWLLGTHQGAVSHDHLEYYLDEFTFRFNRRLSTHRGKLFMRLLENAIDIDPVTYNMIKKGIRGKKSKKQVTCVK